MKGRGWDRRLMENGRGVTKNRPKKRRLLRRGGIPAKGKMLEK
jgi:hypothetical protein